MNAEVALPGRGASVASKKYRCRSRQELAVKKKSYGSIGFPASPPLGVKLMNSGDIE
jgi:hypothetical protein